MKKKLLALFMILVLTMTAFAGCGKDDKKAEKADPDESSFFKECSEMADLELGKSTVNLDFKMKGEALKSQEQAKDFLDDNGDLTAKLTFDVVFESETKFAADISAKVGSKIDGKMATISFDGQYVYLEYAELLKVIKDIAGEEAAASFEQIGTSVKFDYNKVVEVVTQYMEKAGSSQISEAKMAMDIMNAITEISKDKKDEIKDFDKKLFDAMDKKFDNVTGTEDDLYTFTVSNENLGDILDDAKKFLDEDAEAIVNDAIDLFAEAIEKAGTSAEDTKAQVKDAISQASTQIADNKEEIIKSVADTEFKVVFGLNVDEGKGLKFNIKTNDITVEEGMSFGGSLDIDYTAGTESISDKIPADASDITTLITIGLGNLGGVSGAQNSDDAPVVEEASAAEAAQ